MNNIITHILSNDLEDLKGMKIEGRIPVDTDLINEIIEQVLHQEPSVSGSEQASKTGPGNAASRKRSALLSLREDPDLMNLVRKHVKTVKVGTDGEKIVVDFLVQVD